LLVEALAAKGATVTGIDLAEASLAVARLHLEESQLPSIRYLQTSAEMLAEKEPQAFDLVTCLEVLEHVPDPAALVQACARLVTPGGSVVFSTINRNPKAFAFAILGAEYILGLLPKGTHHYENFIRPSELDDWGRTSGLRLQDLSGLHFDPFRGAFSLSEDVAVNYLAHFSADRAA
jgi:2-polyprenyl-6-hydroxyphenyl methylase/3-demethylubiquinone-9 3-methyltransferase